MQRRPLEAAPGEKPCVPSPRPAGARGSGTGQWGQSWALGSSSRSVALLGRGAAILKADGEPHPSERQQSARAWPRAVGATGVPCWGDPTAGWLHAAGCVWGCVGACVFWGHCSGAACSSGDVWVRGSSLCPSRPRGLGLLSQALSVCLFVALFSLPPHLPPRDDLSFTFSLCLSEL